MPVPASRRQPKSGAPTAASSWFETPAGRAVLDSEAEAVHRAAEERPGQPWLRLSAAPGLPAGGGRSLDLHLSRGMFDGPLRCRLPLPVASDSLGAIVLQHVADGGDCRELLEECVRVLVPGGRLWLFALNPLAPYRWRWSGEGPKGAEPITWRRRLRVAGLAPEPVSQGLGPRWRIAPDPGTQDGAGLRAAYLLRAEKRVVPMTPVRARPRLRLQPGVPAA